MTFTAASLRASRSVLANITPAVVIGRRFVARNPSVLLGVADLPAEAGVRCLRTLECSIMMVAIGEAQRLS